jgi:hypothetical protein
MVVKEGFESYKQNHEPGVNIRVVLSRKADANLEESTVNKRVIMSDKKSKYLKPPSTFNVLSLLELGCICIV